MEISSLFFTGESFYDRLHYLFIILLSLPGLGIASLWMDFTFKTSCFGFDYVTNCDYWNVGERERATALNRGFKRQDMFQLALLSFP